MFIGKQGAFLAGVSPLALEKAPETKDGDLAVEVKKAVDALAKTFEDFKAKNDDRLKQVETKRGEDAVTRDEVEKLNKAIDDAQAELKKRLDEMEAKANRLALSGGDGAKEAKAANAFGELINKSDYGVEQLREYKGDLGGYLRRAEFKATTMQVASDPSGGYWVTPDVSGRMVQKIYESTPMRQLANVVQIGTDALEGPIDNGEMEAAWVGEKQTRSQTDTPQLGMWRIPVNELYAYPWVTQKLLEDSKIDVEAWLGTKAAPKFARKENTGFISGDGVLKPKGVLSYDFATTADATRAWGTFQYVPSGAAGAFASTAPADKLIDLIFELKAGYRQNANFLMARRTIAAIRKLKDGQGNYLVDLRLRDGALVESIFGFAVTDGEDMPAIAADSFSILFGDFNEAYTIVDRLGTSVVRDNITQPGFVKFHMRRRTGGGAVNFEALKAMKFASS
ncbi:phage major capsid protein, HK97 family [Sphingomonas sp. YR710]|uniref:phage major capsid protein n=1 Tax=Sphingomonas sp. YR710 TaxID=1882773 RepID=UPI0008861D8C|nr:phage major capsid protein [Sphingomonas sp. YR710]SDC30760.1 phage major capsid protein, HK97 family [Sphingomonas sp. YR710]